MPLAELEPRDVPACVGGTNRDVSDCAIARAEVILQSNADKEAARKIILGGHLPR